MTVDQASYLVGPIVALIAILVLPRKYWQDDIPRIDGQFLRDMLTLLWGLAVLGGVGYFVWTYIDH